MTPEELIKVRAVTPELLDRIHRVAGKAVVGTRRLERGYSPAIRLRVELADGKTAVAKVATVGMTVDALRREKRVYDALGERAFLPHIYGWDDDGTYPLLLMEDLTDAHWPPPWETGQMQMVLDAMEEVWTSHVPDLSALTDDEDLFDGWTTIAADPRPFLSLGLTSEEWLEAALPVLLAVDGLKACEGTHLLHCDLRSDNLCLRDGRAVLIDWNHACYGNPRLEIAAWLPSLAAEGGPAPETVLPNAGDVATVITGYFASRAGLPIIPVAPRVREIQYTQTRYALPWVAREMGLPPPDGPNAI